MRVCVDEGKGDVQSGPSLLFYEVSAMIQCLLSMFKTSGGCFLLSSGALDPDTACHAINLTNETVVKEIRNFAFLIKQICHLILKVSFQMCKNNSLKHLKDLLIPVSCYIL